jgi:hypothetical protein
VTNWRNAFGPPRGEGSAAPFDEGLATGLLLTTIALVVALFLGTWRQPILDVHGFRQTQTALSVYWGIVDGWRWAYETPVVGAPWSVPFELPVFQWVVSLVWRLTGMPLDVCGRLASFLFYAGSALAMAVLLRRLGVSRSVACIGASLFLLAPVNLFWGRAFLIESCALFFALCFAATAVGAIDRTAAGARDWSVALLLVLLAATAALTKITTFVPAAAFVGGYLVVTTLTMARATPQWPSLARRAALAIVPALLALGLTILWVRYSDVVKAQNPIAAHLTSPTLGGWNFGSFAQRTSSELWRDVIWGRAVPESVGSIAVVASIAAAAVLLRGRNAMLFVLVVAVYLGSFLTFTNLHIVHNYYQAANAVWAVMGVTIVLDGIARRASAPALALAVAVAAQQLAGFVGRYAPAVTQTVPAHAQRTLEVSRKLIEVTEPQDVILVFGFDWSSEVAYYAARRTVTVPAWPGLYEIALSQRSRLAAPYAANWAVACGAARSLEPALRSISRGPEIPVSGCVILPIRPR